MMVPKSRDWIRPASEAELVAYSNQLLEQFEQNNAEIERLVGSIQQSQARLTDAMEHMELESYIYNEPLPPEPRRSGWVRLGLAGLLGYWLGSRRG